VREEGDREKETAMGRPRKERKNWDELGTLWEVSDELWAQIAPVVAEVDPPKATGRPRIDARAALNAILFRLRSGCQWNHLPERFPDDSSVHRTFQRWVRLGLFARLWAVLVARCDELAGVNWEWQAADGAMGKARLGGTSSAATPPTAANGA
jgi:putative transposase